MSAPPHILIAGAGIGGLAAALALARRGWRVTLLERRELGEEIGAGLQISPNASRILRDLGVLPRLIESGLTPEAIHIRRARDGATLARLPLADAERRWGAPYILVHRADLARALLDAAAANSAITLHAQTSIAGFEQTEGGISVAALRGPLRVSYAADCLIGADGLRSFVRARLTGEAAPKIARHVAWRALVPIDRVAPEMRKPESTLWLGPGAHLVHYPLRGGAWLNVVAVVDEKALLDETADVWSLPGDPRRIAARFRHWGTPARDLIAGVDDWRLWPLAERKVPRAWSSGRVALLGDAAHAMLPFLAQGAAQAIEDAAALAASLPPDTDIARSLAAYGAARAARVSRVQRDSRRQARIYHLPRPAAVFRDMALRGLGAERLIARYAWLYGGGPPLP